MKLDKVFKTHTPEEVAQAIAYIKEMRWIHKPMVAMNEENKDALLTIFFGADDQYNLIDLANQIQAKCIEYVNVKAEATSGREVVSPETAMKSKIANELIALNKKLEKQLPKDIYSIYTSKFNAMAAFYPSSEFIKLENGDSPKVAHPKSFTHSSVLSNLDNKGCPKGLNYISVTAPTSGAIYTHLADTFSNTAFLVHCLRGSSLSTWSKYTNGRSVPVSVSWGLFLLTLGIHPLYKLEHRTNTKKLVEDPLFKDIFPNWNETFNFEMWEKFRKFDLESYQRTTPPVHEKIDVDAVQQEFRDVVTQWYAEGNSLVGYSTAQKLIESIDSAHQALDTRPSNWKNVYNIILDLSNQKAFKQTQTRIYVEAYSKRHEFNPELDKLIFELSSAASFLHLEANPSPNMYTMLRHLAEPKSGDIQVITSLTGISPETWTRYDQGTRIPHSSAWTSIILSLDIHPIYKVIKRTDEAELEKVFTVYKELHHIVVEKKHEFSLPNDATFEDFMKIVQSN